MVNQIRRGSTQRPKRKLTRKQSMLIKEPQPSAKRAENLVALALGKAFRHKLGVEEPNTGTTVKNQLSQHIVQEATRHRKDSSNKESTSIVIKELRELQRQFRSYQVQYTAELNDLRTVQTNTRTQVGANVEKLSRVDTEGQSLSTEV